MTEIADALGRAHDFAQPPRRIVSLVPSITETLFALGLDVRIVGVTDSCVHPRELVASKPRVGGTKNPSLDAVYSLEPDLVIANVEENRRRDVERLEAAGVRVFVTYVRSVSDAIDEILGRDHSYWVDYRDNVAAVDAADARKAMNKNLDPETMIMLVVGNIEEIMAGHPEHDARLTDFGEIKNVPLRDPMTLKPIVE